MRLGIMQPYFFPYLGYFSLIKHTDQWIVFDTVQYIERGWINRNRIIHPSKPEPMYITVPLKKHHQETVISDILISYDKDYPQNMLSQITTAYKKRAPYYKTIYDMVEEVVNTSFEDIVSLNVETMRHVCSYLGIPFKYQVFSKMNLSIDAVCAPGDWAFNICKAMGADGYINPISGRALFDPQKFENAGISLEFLKIHQQEYPQKKATFLDSLSIIDVLMFNSPDRVNEMLDDYELISGREG